MDQSILSRDVRSLGGHKTLNDQCFVSCRLNWLVNFMSIIELTKSYVLHPNIYLYLDIKKITCQLYFNINAQHPN